MRKEIGRLAMRVEGANWNAYYALSNTMEGAVFLGSIAMVAVTSNPERKRSFMAMMRGVVSEIFEERFGQRPDWTGERPSPEHEKGGQS